MWKCPNCLRKVEEHKDKNSRKVKFKAGVQLFIYNIYLFANIVARGTKKSRKNGNCTMINHDPGVIRCNAFTTLLQQALLPSVLPDLYHVVLPPPPPLLRVHRHLVLAPPHSVLAFGLNDIVSAIQKTR
ncbi:unnamed protein product [Fraxinus pennsylvanica]|uniref:Uncharacterized protein n=1 Tax=Fraxinus pennsylvanica TaxID=56036 RepID=A0AAD1ZZH6_9LAMI|nr:unnamed protein product [Fraxinus pennsylvanica]